MEYLPCFNGSIQRDGIILAFRDYSGDGPPIVLLHGGTRNVADWDEIAALLLPYHRVVAIDLRSHGQSSPCGDTWRFEDAVEDVEAVIAHLTLDRPFVGGHSIGGLVATLYGARHPDSRGAINIDGVGVSVPRHFPGANGERDRQQVQEMIDMMVDAAAPPSSTAPVLLTPDQVAQRIGKATDVALVVRSFFRHADDRYEENPSAAAQSAFSYALIDFDIFDVTRTVQCPLLFVAATEEDTTPSGDTFTDTVRLWRRAVAAEFAAIHETHPNVTYTSIVGDHMIVPHNADAVAAALLAFTAAPPPPLA